MSNIKIKAVAVIDEDGFLAQSAPTHKPRGRPTLILLTHKQRNTLTGNDRLIPYDDIRYQGKFDGSLPTGYLSPDMQKVAVHGWSNAENQWYNAADLHTFLFYQKEHAKHDLRWNESMIYDLILAAA